MKKILSIKLTAIGNIFLALRHVTAICRHHAGDAIGLITEPHQVIGKITKELNL